MEWGRVKRGRERGWWRGEMDRGGCRGGSWRGEGGVEEGGEGEGKGGW